MRLFISQAGPRSRALAEALEPFVRQLASGAEPWMAPTSLAKGTRWAVELTHALKDASAGLVCLTPENLREPWILFEASALSREPSSYLWTFLLDLKDTDLGPQLDQFQNTKTDKDDVFKMVLAMNRVIATAPKSEKDLEYMFNLMWPDLKKRIDEIRAMPAPAAAPPLDRDQALTEMLSTIREIGKQSSKDSWRIQKTMGVLNDLYNNLLHRQPPSLNELLQQQDLRGVSGVSGVSFVSPDTGGVSFSSAPPIPLVTEALRVKDGPVVAKLKEET